MAVLVQTFESVVLNLGSSTQLRKAPIRASPLKAILDEAENVKECVKLIIIEGSCAYIYVGS